jgi:UPF0755 protein
MVVALLAGIIAIGGGAYFAWNLNNEPNDYSGSGAGEVSVTVARGDSLSRIGNTLVSAGDIRSTEPFLSAAALDDRSSTIGPGRYTMREQMSASAALTLMLDPMSRSSSRLVLPEGLRLTQTIELAAKATGIPVDQFEEVIDNPENLSLPSWSESRPPGFMFPATYDIVGDESPETLINAFVKRFNQSASNIDLEARASAMGISPYEIVIIASLLQAELLPDDFAKGAAVVYNRLKVNMPLQFDSTVSYALGIQELQLNAEQLATESPFNTYENRGLPPSPINSPGEAALEAALSPAKGKWLYFVAVNPDTRQTKFARTYSRFLELKKEYRAFLDSNGS